MSWEELKIVAVDSLVGDTGAAVRLPIVRDAEERFFAVRDANSFDVTPNVVLPKDEVGERIASGSWLALPEQVAQKGYVVVVRSPHLGAVCAAARYSNGLPWLPAAGGMEVAYAPRERARAWMAECADALLEWSRRQLRDFFRGKTDKSSLPLVDTVLQQAIYVAAKGTDARRRLDVLTGVLMGEIAPERWPAVVRVILLQTPGLDAGKLQADVARLKKELAPPPWAKADAALRSTLPSTPSFWQEAA